MTTYTISNRDSGATVWTGEAETAKAALEAMASDAGYASYAEACLATEGSGDYDLTKRSHDAWECGRLTIVADALRFVPRLVPPTASGAPGAAEVAARGRRP